MSHSTASQASPSNALISNSLAFAPQSTSVQLATPQPESNALGALTLPFPTHIEQQSPLFKKLPPEIRNRIYKMVFECELDSIHFTTKIVTDRADLDDGDSFYRTYDGEVLAPYLELTDAAMPSPALLQTCQMIHKESIGLFTAAVQTYWDKQFVVTMKDAHIDATYRFRAPGSLSRVHNITFSLRNGPLSVDLAYKLSGDVYLVDYANNSSFQDNDLLVTIDELFEIFPSHGNGLPQNQFNRAETLEALQGTLWSLEPTLRRLAARYRLKAIIKSIIESRRVELS